MLKYSRSLGLNICNRHRLLTLNTSISTLRLIDKLLRLPNLRISYIATIHRMTKMLIGSTIRRNPLKNNILLETRITFTNRKARQ
ncbi:hypothetical protein CISIN_1g034764mg [Citrus sinensis]|uniref:Uncharacterized protein n=1 Tax=Citrus sinensis TaxID=2711 RepID=A0A067EHL9_CITSI|nr:hypothetical protein CISIN_1g034764mg [Citrus sinensis]